MQINNKQYDLIESYNIIDADKSFYLIAKLVYSLIILIYRDRETCFNAKTFINTSNIA